MGSQDVASLGEVARAQAFEQHGLSRVLIGKRLVSQAEFLEETKAVRREIEVNCGGIDQSLRCPPSSAMSRLERCADVLV